MKHNVNYSAEILLHVRQTWITKLILAVSMWGVIFLFFREEPVTHMHGLAFYVNEGLPFTRDVSLEISTDSYV